MNNNKINGFAFVKVGFYMGFGCIAGMRLAEFLINKCTEKITAEDLKDAKDKVKEKVEEIKTKIEEVEEVKES